MSKPSIIGTPYEVQACGDCDCCGKRLGNAIQVELDSGSCLIFCSEECLDSEAPSIALEPIIP